jgi:uncharacterized membrane protein YfcA
MTYFELCLAGVVGGFLAGLLGIGGGFIVVPALMFLLPALGVDPGLVPKVAVATSLAAMIPTASSAVFAQYRRSNLDLAWVRRLMPVVAIGAALGSQVAAATTGPWVAAIFASYTGYFAVRMLRDLPLQSQQPGLLARAVRAAPVPLVSALIGLVSALAGVGGASLTVPYLLLLGVEMKRAVALASAVGLTIALAGSLGFASDTLATPPGPHGFAGWIHWPAALALAATATIMAPRGVAVADRLPVRHLKRAFGALCLVACVATLVRQAELPSAVLDSTVAAVSTAMR